MDLMFVHVHVHLYMVEPQHAWLQRAIHNMDLYIRTECYPCACVHVGVQHMVWTELYMNTMVTKYVCMKKGGVEVAVGVGGRGRICQVNMGGVQETLLANESK